ncbi:MAG: serine hydrolase [Candidatus Promineifilaceae bacterium]|nr:serine hydrolase [Candidatus Promineifilaceae bacterium]
MRRKSSFWKQIRRSVFTLLVLATLLFFLRQLFFYQQSRRFFPAEMTIAGMDVGGMTAEEAGELLRERYTEPVAVYHGEERIELKPSDVGFNLEVDPMLASAHEAVAQQNYWVGYLYYVLGWTWRPITVPLQAGYDPTLLREMLVVIADFLDQPPQGPQILSETAVFEEGRGGYVTDVEASLPLVEAALYRPDDRVAHLVVIEEEAPELSMDLLENVIRAKLNSFDGLGSVFILDLQTGEEININADVALSGLSILKIPIFIEAWRHLELPLNDYEEQLFYETAVRSSNYAANLLLHVVAGENNTYKGADILTESMWNLGLENTFMAVPYDAIPPPHRRTTYQTPANSIAHQEVDSYYLDPTRQTTAEDIGSLLGMLYHCAQGGGTLLVVYPGEITPEECQYVIDLMILNEEGNLIRFGVPDKVPVSHKHGWIPMTHGDAGIVLSPGGDYVLVEYLHQNSDWLQADVSFPILREISRAVYNYFNFDEPYVGDALNEEERFEDGVLPPEGGAPEAEEPPGGEEPAAEEPATGQQPADEQTQPAASGLGAGP